MSAPPALSSASPAPMVFPNLPRFSGAECDLMNWGARFLREGNPWEERLRDTLGDLLESPDQKEWIVHIRHWMDRERPVSQIPFEAETLGIGRAEENAVVLPESTINREHARLLRRGDGYFLEDLGSRLGTFIGDQKLMPHTPTQLSPGVTFTIFPYSLEVTSRYRWRREDRFRVHSARTRFCSWQEAREQQASDAIAVPLRFPPGDGVGAFAVTGKLLDELLRGLIGKDHLAAAGLLATDAGCLDTVLAALSERLREELRWPFVAEFGSWMQPPGIAQDTRGLQVVAQVSIRDCAGTVRLFLPAELLASMRTQSPARAPRVALRELEWRCALEIAEVPLPPGDLESVGPGDTIVFRPQPRLRLPGGIAGYRARMLDGNFGRYSLDNSVERLSRVQSPSSPSNATTPGAGVSESELRQLPVLLQVILGERQFSLAELESFTEGTVISLERGDSEPVRLAVNGKVLGSGELVRVEDHLGVRVLGWNQ